MKHPTLFDAPRTAPSRRQLLNEWKRKNQVETHYCRGLDDPWMACHIPSARQVADGYEDDKRALAEMGLAGLVAGYCRLLDEAGVLQEAKTEREAIELVCLACELTPPNF